MSSTGGKMNNQTQSNINAAKLAGHRAHIQSYKGLSQVTITILANGSFQQYERPFDIFANTPKGAYDREQVVIALGEKHGVTICSAPMKRWAFFIKDATNDCVFDTYLDALEAALESIKES